MELIDRLFYNLKNKAPGLYEMSAPAASAATAILFRQSIKKVKQNSQVKGKLLGRDAEMRSLLPQDVDIFHNMITKTNVDHLKYFNPHGMDRHALAKVINRPDVLTSGLFVDDKMCAYSLLKLFPTRKAYIGRLVSVDMVGLGVGKYLSRYLYHQSYLLRFQPCSTIHEHNLASLKSHASVRPFTVAAELPGGYLLIKFDLLPEDANLPKLNIEKR